MGSKGASLNPDAHQGGGQIQNGNYDITKVRAGLFTYQGQVPEGVPAIMVTYKADGVEYEQPYKAGDNAHLVASEDGKTFVHPTGEAASYFKGGAASLWLGSLAKCGFKFSGDDVTQIEGIKVTIENLAAPKGRGTENKDKVIPMVTAILGKAVASPKSNPAAATSSITSPVAVGDLDKIATTAALMVLEAIPDHKTVLKGFAVRCLKFAPGIKLNDLTKLMTPEWLLSKVDIVGWATDGIEVSFEGLEKEMLKTLIESL
jgi:hypothetical protein